MVFEDFRTGLTTLENGCLVEFTGETGVAGMQRNSLDGVIGKREVAELWCVANWLDTEAHNLRLIYCDHPLSSRYPRLDNFRIKKDLALV